MPTVHIRGEAPRIQVPHTTVTVSAARGESWADVARRVGEIADIVVPAGSTDLEVLTILTTALAEIVAAAQYSVIEPVRAATTADITLSGAQTIDGIAVVAGNRVLVKDQSSGAQNGIYVAAAGAWSRATDFDQTSEVIQGSYVRVTDGDSMSGAWVLVTADSITVGSTVQTWRMFSVDAFERLASTRAGMGASLVTGLVLPVYSRTSMKAVSTVRYKEVFLHEGGRSGIFMWDPDVPVATHQDDTAEGLYVAPESGEDGAWVRCYQGMVSVKWFGAIGDGVADDTAACQAAIDTVENTISGYLGEVTGMALLFPAGVYLITAPLEVPTNGGIKFFGEYGTASTVFIETPATDCFQVNGNNYRGGFFGLRFAGPAGQVVADCAAIRITGNGNQISAQDCWCGTLGFFVYGEPHSDSIFSHNTIEFVGTPFKLLGSGNGYFTITENSFYNCGPVSAGGSERGPLIDLEDTIVANISHNRFVADSPMSPQAGGLVKFTNCEDINFDFNIFSAGTVYTGATFVIDGGSRINILHNSLPPPNLGHIAAVGVENLTVENNRFPAQKSVGLVTANMIELEDCPQAAIGFNDFGSATNYVIYSHGASGEDVDISNNKFDGGPDQDAYSFIYVTGQDRVNISHNRMRDPISTAPSITVDTSAHVVVIGNVGVNSINIDPTCGPATYYGNIGCPVTAFTAPPLIGTWHQGNVLPDHSAGPGEPAERYCVTGGTPGTWKDKAPIEA